jgi:PAS domain S-box-containing protein
MPGSSDPPHDTDTSLQTAELLLRAVLDTASGLIYAKDLSGRMLIANPPTLNLIGKPWSEVRGRTDAEFLDDPAQGETIMANDRRIMRDGVPEVLEEHVDSADGASQIWLSTKAPLYDDAGVVIGLVGISQNITERKQAEQRLFELNETLEQRVAERTRERDRAWNNSQDLLVVLDGAGTFQAVNCAWTAVLGWSPAELVNRSFLDFIHPDDHPSSRGALADATAAPLMHYENRYRHQDGSYRWISWVASPDADRIYASGRHITAEKAAAAALAAKAAQLEASNRELESFTYSVSHDLRAPLRAIDGFGVMLEEDYGGLLDAEGRRLLSTMRDNARRMGVLIDDLLAFSRLSHASLNVTEVNVDGLVREVIAELPTGGGACIDFDLGPLAPVQGDRGLLRQAWINLLSNAVKYSSTVPRPRVEIRSRVDALQTVYTVRDNGVGFDMKYVDKLFGVFHRLHAADEFAGTGVGLAIVHRIVTRHGGRIWAEGELLRGALFSFSLPNPGREHRNA